MKLFGKEVLPLKPNIRKRYFEDAKARYPTTSFVLDIKLKGRIAAEVEFRHHKFPVEHFFIDGIDVRPAFKSRSSETTAGVGGSILRYIEFFLRRRARAGKCCLAVLDNGLHFPSNKNAPEVLDMYEKHGWKRFGSNSNYLYRSPRRIKKQELNILKLNY